MYCLLEKQGESQIGHNFDPLGRIADSRVGGLRQIAQTDAAGNKGSSVCDRSSDRCKSQGTMLKHILKKTSHHHGQFLCMAFIVLGFSAMTQLAHAASEPLLAYAARIAGDDARTRIVIDFAAKPSFSVHYLANPERIIIDLDETAFAFAPDQLTARGLYSDIRYGTMTAGKSRIVLSLTRTSRLAVAEVQKNEQDSGYRLVLDAEMTRQEQFSALVKNQNWQQGAGKLARSDRIGTTVVEPSPSVYTIAVDAGHGGIDTGASGVDSKTEEKTITLDYAKKLADALNREPGVKAILTRDSDVFLSLSERVMIARQQNANLFISIHADTLQQKDIRGATVYTISDKASDSLAANLAQRENKSDEIAGVTIENEPADVADILIDLARRETQAFSINLASNIVKSFEGQIRLINNPHRHAGFQVLQAPDVPSVLLELGFLSNPDDEKMLQEPEFRDKTVSLIVDAVRRYRGNPGAVAN
jgi:N-acetylmuramoyl-L-alanine amidase